MAEQDGFQDEEEKSYDDFPYESLAVKQTHPYHLFTLAKLYGFDAVQVEQANVLELGCASGGNLIPMAFHLTKARFVGLDLSQKQIAQGQQKIHDLQLNNIELHHQSIIDFKTKEKFDYIICHGLYSWVDEAIQKCVFEICRLYLSRKGIAYISYNTLPGWRQGETLRDLMQWHTARYDDPAKKITEARSLLSAYFDKLKEEGTAFAALMQNEIALVQKHPDNQLIHEHLGAINSPCYFHQFMRQAHGHQLHFLSEAFLTNMMVENLPSALTEDEDNRIASGQYMDFIKNRRFRATLLCREALVIDEQKMQESIAQLYLRLMALPENLAADEVVFANSTMRFYPRDAVTKQAMLILWQTQYQPLHFETLCQQVANLMPAPLPEVVLQLKKDLLQAALGGIIDISSERPDYTSEISKKPCACPLARYQVYMQNTVTNRRHENIALTTLAQALLPHLDGEHDLPMLVEVIGSYIEEGVLVIQDENHQIIPMGHEHLKQIETICLRTIDLLAKQALLIN